MNENLIFFLAGLLLGVGLTISVYHGWIKKEKAKPE
jgi:hypothetical protein